MLPTKAGPSSLTVFALYRSLVREVRKLPHDYLRLFFRIKVADDVRAILDANKDYVRRSKFRRVTKEFRRVKAANGGDSDAWVHVLDVATGRKGKLRWEIMQPLLNDPNAPPPPRIIAAVESSRPPVYSPELTALLTSDLSRSPKGIKPAHLKNPHTLPERANPSSEEARLLGRLSERREVNIRWRFFVAAWKKVIPPLQVVTEETSQKWEPLRTSTTPDDLSRAGIRPVGLQDAGVMEGIVEMAGPAWQPASLTRRQRQALIDQGVEPPPSPSASPVPKFVRRQYGSLLARLPVLKHVRRTGDGVDPKNKGKYEISLAPNAIIRATRHNRERLAQADEVDLAWIEAANVTRGSVPHLKKPIPR